MEEEVSKKQTHISGAMAMVMLVCVGLLCVAGIQYLGEMKYSSLQVAGQEASPVTQAESQRDPFSEKPLARPHVHVEGHSLFRPWLGGEIPLGAYDPSVFKRVRWGTISLATNVQAHIDAVQDTVHFPSYFEFIDVNTGSLLGIVAVSHTEDSEWYFSGNAAAYLNHGHTSLCDTRYTRKFSITAKALTEVRQPMLYIGAETKVLQKTPLYESPSNKTVVATVLPETTVTVIGIYSGLLPPDSAPPLLVKTPFGLIGWHRRDIPAPGGSSLSIYDCN